MVPLQTETAPGTDQDMRDGEERRKRLQEARLHAGYESARAAAQDHLDLFKESTYRSHENGTRPLNRVTALRYAQAFGVSGEWLYTGKGPMVDPSATRANANLQHKLTFPLSHRQLPVYGVAQAGPEGIFILTQGTVVSRVPCPPILESVENAYAVSVAGNSMEPRYFSRELVFTNPALSPRAGDFVVVQRNCAGELLGYIKRFLRWTDREIVLEQFNPPAEMRFPRREVEAVHVIVQSGMAS